MTSRILYQTHLMHPPARIRAPISLFGDLPTLLVLVIASTKPRSPGSCTRRPPPASAAPRMTTSGPYGTTLMRPGEDGLCRPRWIATSASYERTGGERETEGETEERHRDLVKSLR